MVGYEGIIFVRWGWKQQVRLIVSINMINVIKNMYMYICACHLSNWLCDSLLCSSVGVNARFTANKLTLALSLFTTL